MGLKTAFPSRQGGDGLFQRGINFAQPLEIPELYRYFGYLAVLYAQQGAGVIQMDIAVLALRAHDILGYPREFKGNAVHRALFVGGHQHHVVADLEVKPGGDSERQHHMARLDETGRVGVALLYPARKGRADAAFFLRRHGGQPYPRGLREVADHGPEADALGIGQHVGVGVQDAPYGGQALFRDRQVQRQVVHGAKIALFMDLQVAQVGIGEDAGDLAPEGIAHAAENYHQRHAQRYQRGREQGAAGIAQQVTPGYFNYVLHFTPPAAAFSRVSVIRPSSIV